MEKTDFVHLHSHSHYSLLRALPTIDELVEGAKEKGYDAVTLTDLGSMYGAIEFYKKCQQEDMKPIIGFEAFVAPDSRHNQEYSEGEPPHHQMILLAENFAGYQNLMKLSSKGHLEGLYREKPRVDKGLLREFSDNIIALSGPIEGEVPSLLDDDKYDEAKEAALEYQEIFGEDNFYLELQDHPGIEGQMQVNTQLEELSDETGIPMVVTRDVRYLESDQAEAQHVLRCIDEGWKIDQNDEVDNRHVDRSLNEAEDIISRFKHNEEALKNTRRIADRINIEIELDDWHFAPAEEIGVPEDVSAKDYLRQEVYDRVFNTYDEVTPEIVGRIEYELAIIEIKGYSPYFLCVADYVQFARDRGIVETTRGSAAGSLVSYILDITIVDPVRFQLPFERFLNPYRPSAPDIDTDFADDRRDEVIRYLFETYGEDRVAQIITFGTMKARGSVRDAGRVLGYSYSFCDQVAKLIPMESDGIAEAIEDDPELNELYNENEKVERLLNLSQQIEGRARHTSIHAAGVVISPSELTNFTPVQLETDGDNVVSQYEMHSVESAGVLKYDVLGIRNLSILGNAVDLVEETTGEDINIYDLPYDDKKTYEMLAEGHTEGVFQMSGAGMTRWVKEMEPERIEDLMALVALYRPGPMEFIPEYIDRKEDASKVDYPHPKLEDVLKQSYGLLIYQEDVMLTAIELAGYDWEEADKFRKAMGKKIPELMEKQEKKFKDGCEENGIDRELADELWERIKPFAEYAFNKCVPGDTRVFDTRTGTPITVKELYESSRRPDLQGIDDQLKNTTGQIEGVYENGIKKTFEITTRSGRKVEATSNHPLRTFDGWEKLENLQVGDRIAVPRKIAEPDQPCLIPDYKAAALGYLLAEGNFCHHSGIYFYSSSQREIDDFAEYAREFSNAKLTYNTRENADNVYVGRKNKQKENTLYDWINELGLKDKKATEKYIPKDIFQLPNEQLALFLGKLWQGDGTVSMENTQLFYATSSRQLADDVQYLLLRFGILSTIHTKTFKYRGDEKTGFTVVITHRENITRFNKYISKHLVGKKQRQTEKLAEKSLRVMDNNKEHLARGTVDTIPDQVLGVIREEMNTADVTVKEAVKKTGLSKRLFSKDERKRGYQRGVVEQIAETFDFQNVRNIADSDVLWDEIVEIEPKEEKMTYDISVPPHGNFVADNILVHNSHASSYGIVAYQTAYMKANYPVQFMTSILKAESGDEDKVAEVVRECSSMDIKVLPPDINESEKNFAMVSEPGEPGRIRFGLNAIKNVGDHICEVIEEERKENGHYSSLEDFLERVQDKDLNKTALECLAKVGAMDCFGYSRNELLQNVKNMRNYNKKIQEKMQTNQGSLFSQSSVDIDSEVRMEEAKPASMEQKLKWEKELLGIYLSSHPFKDYQEELSDILTPLGEIETLPKDEWVVTGGVIDDTDKKITKHGSPMMFSSIQDTTGKKEYLAFPKAYKKTKEHWEEGNIVVVVGRTPEDGGDDKIFAQNVYEIKDDNLKNIKTKLKYKTPNGNSGSNGENNQNKNLKSSQNNNSSANEDDSGEKSRVIINLSKSELKQKMDDLKKFFENTEGSTQVYLRVGSKTIKADSQVKPEDHIISQLEQIVGSGKIQVE